MNEPRPATISALPFESRSSVANSWNTRTGSAALRTVTALVRRMRRLRAAAAARITVAIARFLLGFIFLVFGLNGFLHFIPSSPPSGTAGQFVGALFASHYLVPIFLLQVISAVLLLVNRYVPLALTLLAPIIVNILLIHILMLPSGLPLALVVTVLWIVVFLSVRSAFAGLFQQRVAA